MDPGTILAAAKATAAVLSSEKTRKAVGWIIAAILSPVIIIVVILCSLLYGTAGHNNAAVELCFNGGVISANMPAEYRAYIEDMRRSFTMLDGTMTIIEALMEDGDHFDRTRVKAIFYALFFGEDSPSLLAHIDYINCFVTYETRTRIVTRIDENGEEYDEVESYIVAVPIEDLPTIWSNVASAMGRQVRFEDQVNASEIYHRVLYGGPLPDWGDEYDDWMDGLPPSDEPFVGADGFCSPLGSNWRALVTSEMGWRPNPTGSGRDYHTGIDLESPTGTPIRAALPGTVQFVRFGRTGYGNHLAIDHGGGFVTLYAHCSQLLVTEGQHVEAGEVIARVGATGNVTGPHLHFEVRLGGEKKNPRNYLS